MKEKPSEPPFALRGDRPIESANQDRLGRAAFARALATQILDSPALDSYVVAIMGPWGSGKTSLVNMVAEVIQDRSDTVVIRFNPWIFSGTEQLVGHFFRELGAQIAELRTDRLGGVGEALQTYAGLFGSVAEWIPAVGTFAKKAADLVKDGGEVLARPMSVEAQRAKIRDRLLSSEQRVLVLVDDIDRLRRDEIRELVKLVRLTGDFPNIVYVIAFDRKRVEEALGDDDETGRAYLEKIVQVSFDVPVALETDISKLLLKELEEAARGIDHGFFDEGEWPNVFHEVIRPLIRTARDVRRYVNGIPATLRVIGHEVALVDVLALEAVRTFLPDLFAKLPKLVDRLTTRERDRESTSAREAATTAIRKLAEGPEDAVEVIRAFLSRIFPFSAHYLGGTSYGVGFEVEWERKRRVAVTGPLRFYLERRLPDGVVETATVESAFSVLGDREELSKLFDNLDGECLEDLFGRLEAYEEEFSPSQAEAGLSAILDQMNRLRQGRAHMFDFGAEIAVGRIVLRLLRRIPDATDREACIERLLLNLRWLSAQEELIRVANGHDLAPKASIEKWKLELIERASRVSPDSLMEERNLAPIVVQVVAMGGEAEARMRASLANDDLFGRLLASALGDQHSMPLGDSASKKELRLPWPALSKLFGEEELKKRVQQANARLSGAELPPRVKQALDLAVKYADGWRPKDPFGNRER